jgi:hypothetical protein
MREAVGKRLVHPPASVEMAHFCSSTIKVSRSRPAHLSNVPPTQFAFIQSLINVPPVDCNFRIETVRNILINFIPFAASFVVPFKK